MKSFRLYLFTPPEESSRSSSYLRTVLPIMAMLTCLVLAIYLMNSFFSPKPEPMPKSQMGRDYSQLPFDMLDATEICKFKTTREHKTKLRLLYIDSHSSHFDGDSNLYKVFLKAHIGERDEFEEALVYCFVDPEEQVLKHFRTVFAQDKSILTRALNFFKLGN